MGSDHNLVMVKIRVKLKVLSKKTVKRKCCELSEWSEEKARKSK